MVPGPGAGRPPGARARADGGIRRQIEEEYAMALEPAALSGLVSRVLGWVPKLGLVVGAAGIALMVILIIAEIISTKLFDLSLPYVLEYTEYLIPIIVFWGAAYTLREGGHVRADILVHRLPEGAREWVLLAGYVLGFAFLVLVSKQLWHVGWLSFKMNRVSFYPTPSPLGPPQLFAALGLFLFTFQLVVEIAKKARRLYRRYRPGAPG